MMKKHCLNVVDSTTKSLEEIREELAKLLHQENVGFELNGKSVPELLRLVPLNQLPVALQAVGFPSWIRAGYTKFYCDKLGMTLVSPCELRNCAYNVDYAQSDNCILAHAYKHDVQTLTQAEISYLTQLHPSAVSKLLTRSMIKLRRIAIGHAIQDMELTPDFVLVPSDDVCVVCESLISSSDEAFYSQEGFSWCSDACFEEQRVTEIELEHRYGIEVDKLISWLVSKFGSWDCDDYVIDQMAQAVVVDFTAFKMLFIQVRDSMAKQKQSKAGDILTPVGDRRKLRRLAKLPMMHAPLQGALSKRYGSGDLDSKAFEDVAQDFDLLLAS